MDSWGEYGGGAGQYHDPMGIAAAYVADVGANPGNPAQLTWPFLTRTDNGYGGSVEFTYEQKPAPPVDDIWTRQVVVQRAVTSDPKLKLSGHWNMDESLGNSALDTSGNGNTGVLTNGPSWIDGRFGEAIGLDGADDYVQIADDATLDFGTGDFTISAWLKTTASSTSRILGKVDGDGTTGGSPIQYHFYTVSDGKLYFKVADGSSTVTYKTTNAINDGEWHHLMGTWKGSTDTMKVYLDGVEESNQVENTGSIGSLDNTGSFRIGRAGSDTPIAGSIDEVRIYSRALSESEVGLLYDNGDKGAHSLPMVTFYSYNGNPEYYEDSEEEDPKFNAEYRGFREVTETQSDKTHLKHYFYTTGSFTVQHPIDGSVSRDGDKLTGREYKTEWYTPSAQQLQYVFNDWQYNWIDQPSNRYEVRLDGGGIIVDSHKKWTDYTYDSYGNALTEAYSPDAGTARKTYRGYTPNTTDWIVNRPDFERTYEGLGSDDRGSNLRSEGRFYYDSQAYQTAPIKGDLTMVEVYEDSSTFNTTTYGYDTYGNKTSVTDPESNTTSYAFDSTYHTYLDQITYPTVSAGTFIENYWWSSLLHTMTKQRDVNGQDTEYEYDVLGRLTKAIRPGDSSTDPTVKYSYLDWGTSGLQRVKIETKVASGPATYIWAEEYYDAVGRVMQVRQQGDGGNDVVSATQLYAGRGHLSSAYTNWEVVDTTGSGYIVPPGGTLFTFATYDVLGRVTSERGFDGDVVTSSWVSPASGSVLWEETVTDALGHQKRYGTDYHGRLVKVEEFDDSPTPALYQTTTYTYDVTDNITEVVVDPVDEALPNPTATMTYDWLGRKLTMNDPDMGAWSYVYDDNGNLTSQTDAESQTIAFEYDALDRLTRRCNPNWATTVLATNGYDDTTGGNKGKGRRTSLTDESGSALWVYDARGRVTQKTKTISATPYTTSYAYDNADRLSTVTVPGGEVITQTYNNRSLASTLSSSVSGSIVSSSTYNKIGSPTRLNLNNGVRTDYQYWGLEHTGTPAEQSYGQLYRINTYRTSDSLQHQDLKYTWDAAGNLTTREDIVTPYREDFTYDFLDRLSSASTSQSISTGLQGHWKLDEGSGTTASDSSGNGNDGTLTNGPTWVSGRFNNALHFDGVNDYVDVPDSNDFTFGDGSSDSPFSVALWINLDDATDGVIIGKGPQSTTGEWTLHMAGTDFLSWRLRDTSAGGVEAFLNTDFAFTQYQGQWIQVVATYDGRGGATAAQGLKLYVNGTEATDVTRTDNASYVSMENNAVALHVGYNGTNNFLEGSLDDVRIYDRALGSDEVEALYNQYYETYAYNALGNITSKTGQGSYTYGSQPHAVTSTAMGGSFVYDLNGNMTSRNGTTLTWDVENRVTAYGGTATFSYDGDGGRVLKTEGGDTVHYVNRYYEKNVTTGDVTIYYWHGGKLLAVKKGSTLEYVHTDHLGSVSRTTDTSGALVRSEDDFPYGSVRAESGAPPTERSFTGQRRDSTGLLFYNARYYDPAIGRFVSADTIVPNPSNSQVLDRYAYVSNNPLKYVDPSGHIVTIGGVDVMELVKTNFAQAMKDNYIASEFWWDIYSMWMGYRDLQLGAGHLTGYLEESTQVVNIELGDTMDETVYGQTEQYSSGRIAITIGRERSRTSGKLASQLAHEGFHAATMLGWMGTGATTVGPSSVASVANEALAYSLEYQVAAYYRVANRDSVAASFSGYNPDNVAKKIRAAREALIGTNIPDYSVLPRWGSSFFKDSRDRFLTVAQTVWPTE